MDTLKNMITKNNIINGVVCGAVCVIFMWTYMHFSNMNMSGMKMDMENKKSSHMMQMPDGSMMPMSNDSIQMSDGNSMGDMTMNDMVKMMDGKTGKGLEKEFVTGMIPHHQGAVDMAKKLLQNNTISPEMKKFAEDIIKAQESEIKMMKGWLETRYK